MTHDLANARFSPSKRAPADATPAALGVFTGRSLAENPHIGVEQIGGKAANLAWLVAHGYHVPTFIVLSADACSRILGPARPRIDAALAAVDTDNRESLDAAASAVAAAVADSPFPQDIGAALQQQLTQLGPGVRFAVRSSVSGEDSASHSFAGQLDTLLNVAQDGLLEAVLACLASAYSPRSLFYRSIRGMLAQPVDAAVIVQPMIDSAVAGVCFSCNPQTGDTDEIVVSAGMGLGEGVVSGLVECDTFFLDSRTLAISTTLINEKTSRIVATESGGTAQETTPPVQTPVLTDRQAVEIAATTKKLADELEVPQDVEWAIDDRGALHILQTRPVTATGGQQTIFDNVNVAESYPGLSSPLTFTFIQQAYSEVFRTCHRYFGATRKTIAANVVGVYPYLLAYIHGHIYYNISNWYRLFLQVPGMDFAISGWEAALGIENRYQRPPTRQRLVARLGKQLWFARAMVILVYGCLRLPARLRAFFKDLQAATVALDHLFSDQTPAHQRSAHHLVVWLERFMDELAPSYSAQIFNDFIAQQLFKVVETFLRRAGIDDPHSVRNQLFCGQGGVESVDPVRSALELTDEIRQNPDLLALFEDGQPAEVWAAIGSNDKFSDFRARCDRHIQTYGDRTINELKLETSTLADQPEQLVIMLCNFLRAGTNVSGMADRERQARANADEQVRSAMASHPFLRVVFSVALSLARKTVKQRESMRLGRSRCFGLAKRVYRRLGAHFQQADLLDDPADIFYLTYQEVFALVRGTFVDADPRALVAARRGDHTRWASEKLASRIVTTDIAAAHINEPEFTEADDSAVLHGIGCGPGKVKATALVLAEPTPDASVNGEVLVATTTDPGWVFLMIAAAGLVSEKGSILSHTAIIGRELGIPTVVGVPGATKHIRTGEPIALDGLAGTVTLER